MPYKEWGGWMGLLLVGACLTVKSKLISSLLKLYVNSCLIELVSSIQRKNFPGGGGAGQPFFPGPGLGMHPLKSTTKLVSFWQGYTVIGLGSDNEKRSKGLLFVFPCTENCENVKFQNLKREIQKMICSQFEALSFALWSSLCTRRCRQDCTKHRGGKHQLDCEQLQIITAQSLCIIITRIDNIWLKLSHSIQDFSASSTNLRVIFLNVLNENVQWYS